MCVRVRVNSFCSRLRNFFCLVFWKNVGRYAFRLDFFFVVANSQDSPDGWSSSEGVAHVGLWFSVAVDSVVVALLAFLLSYRFLSKRLGRYLSISNNMRSCSPLAWLTRRRWLFNNLSQTHIVEVLTVPSFYVLVNNAREAVYLHNAYAFGRGLESDSVQSIRLHSPCVRH